MCGVINRYQSRRAYIAWPSAVLCCQDSNGDGNETIVNNDFPDEEAQNSDGDVAIDDDVAVNGAQVGSIGISAITDITLAQGNSLGAEMPVTGEDVTVTLTYNNSGNPSSQGFLDFIALEVPRALQGTGEQIVLEIMKVLFYRVLVRILFLMHKAIQKSGILQIRLR